MKDQRGIAVLTAMIILALCASISAAMIWHRNIDIQRTANILHKDQAKYYALGMEAWACEILHRDAVHSKTDSLGERWASHLPVLPIQGGSITAQLVDLQGRFNLNNLIEKNQNLDEDAARQFRRLLALLKLDPGIAAAVADWIDADRKPRDPAGAEDSYYKGLAPPYLAANQPFTSVSELLLVKGVSYKAYIKLRPFVAALPVSNSPINVNTAPWPVIASLTRKISVGEAKALVKQRGRDGFQSLTDFTTKVDGDVDTGQITLTSHYFRLHTTAKIGESSVTLYSLLERRKNAPVEALKHTFGTL